MVRAIMRDENTLLSGGDLKHLRIAQPDDPAIRRRREIHGALPAADGEDDVVIEVSVSLEVDQDRGSPASVRARCRRSQSAGFVSESGGPADASNSRLLASR